jgi:hypothetical protein
MLYQRLWIMTSYTKPVVVNHGVLCGASGCESWCAIIAHHDSQPLSQHYTLWLTPTGSAKLTMTHNHLLSTTHDDSQSITQDYTPWFTITCSGFHTMIYNHWFSITHDNSHPLAWCVMLSQRLWIMVWYDEPVAVNHGLSCCAKGCESWWIMLSQWLWIRFTTTGLSIAYHDSQPLAQNNISWFTTTSSE